jgi:hypothetical protein
MRYFQSRDLPMKPMRPTVQLTSCKENNQSLPLNVARQGGGEWFIRGAEREEKGVKRVNVIIDASSRKDTALPHVSRQQPMCSTVPWWGCQRVNVWFNHSPLLFPSRPTASHCCAYVIDQPAILHQCIRGTEHICCQTFLWITPTITSCIGCITRENKIHRSVKLRLFNLGLEFVPSCLAWLVKTCSTNEPIWLDLFN